MVLWQLRLGSMWVDMDTATCIDMETAFRTASVQTVQMRGPFPASMMVVGSQPFDVHKMMWADMPVRRCKSTDDMDTAVSVEYWDDHAWVTYDKYSTCLVAEAFHAGRDVTTIYVGGIAYDLLLDSQNPMQINRDTGRARPMRVRGLSGIDDDDDDDDDDHVIADDDSMPNEFKCPITSMPMVNPVVVAGDGFTYEKKAIARWLMTKQKSPVTGKPIVDARLVSNITLRNMIRDYASTKAAGVGSSSGGGGSSLVDSGGFGLVGIAKKKKMRTLIRHRLAL